MLVVLLIFLLIIISVSFKFKEKITDQTSDDGANKVEIMVPLNDLGNFRSSLEMPLIVKLILF